MHKHFHQRLKHCKDYGTLIEVIILLEEVVEELVILERKVFKLEHEEFLKIKFGGSKYMPLIIPATNPPDQGFITLTVNGALVSALPNGPDGKPQTLQLVGPDDTDFTIVQDAVTVVDPDGTIVAASFLVTPKNPPSQPNVPLTVVANIFNTDGSLAATISDTVEVTTNPAITETVGILFEQPVSAQLKKV